MYLPNNKNLIGIIFSHDDIKSIQASSVLEYSLDRLGFEIIKSNNIDKVIEKNPYFVVSTTGNYPKAYPCFAYYFAVSDPGPVLKNERKIRNILTYDAYISCSDQMSKLIEDLNFGLQKPKPQLLKSPPLAPSYFHIAKEVSKPIIYTIINDQTSEIYIKIYEALKAKLDLQIINDRGYSYEELLNLYSKKTDSNYVNVGLFLEDTFNNTSNDLYAALALSQSDVVVCHSNNKNLGKFTPFNVNLGQNTIDQISESINKNILDLQRGEALQNFNEQNKINSQILSSEKFLKSVFKHHHSILTKKMYLKSSNNKISVSYIIRTGGERLIGLKRALKSLIYQSHKNITVIFVCYKDISDIKTEIEKIVSNKLNLIFIDDFGGLRGDAISVGMKYVKTDYFGLLDDDDYLMPNHVETLLNTINRQSNTDLRGEIKLAYSGSFYHASNNAIHEKQEWMRVNKENYHKSKFIVEHYRFFDPHSMSTHRWYMMSNSWLAHNSLICDDMLNKPGTHTCEDLYFELLMATKTYFAFSGEMTAAHNWDNYNSTHVDNFLHKSDTLTHGIRLMTRLIAGGNQYVSPYAIEYDPNKLIELYGYTTDNTKYDSNVVTEKFTNRGEWFNAIDINQNERTDTNFLIKQDIYGSKYRFMKAFIFVILKYIASGQFTMHNIKNVKNYYKSHGYRALLHKIMSLRN